MKNLLLLTTAIFASFSGSPYLPLIAPDLSDHHPVMLFESANRQAIHTLHLPSQPLGQAHAHNDYEQERPLFDALENGFNFIEVDVFLIENELYVSHLHPIYLNEKNTLREMYLKPLERLVEKNNGRIFPQSEQPLFLMIDIKTAAGPTYETLKKYLRPYCHFLTHFSENKKEERAVTIFLSGNRPVEKMAAEAERFMCLDGRIEDLGKGYPPELMPVVSERFSNVFGPQFFWFERVTRKMGYLRPARPIDPPRRKKNPPLGKPRKRKGLGQATRQRGRPHQHRRAAPPPKVPLSAQPDFCL